jgi:predicted NBD/HSP70 family sugar kinase/mannose-6-phosphate isomerase class I
MKYNKDSLQTHISIGIDVGGSHVSAGLVTVTNINELSFETIHKPIDSSSNAITIIDSLSSVINEAIGENKNIKSIGIAMPGPFNYQKGISEIHGVGGKFSNTFGLNMALALKNKINLPIDTEILFANDAHCFAKGAAHLVNLNKKPTICLTLGTGFGSAFLNNNNLVFKDENIPAQAAFYCEVYKDSIADDYFSSRWFLNEFFKITGNTAGSVKDIAEMAEKDDFIKSIFVTFGKNLADFLLPWLKKFTCEQVVIGGNIAKAWHLSAAVFAKTIAENKYNVNVLICENTEKFIICGAALLAEEKKQTADIKSTESETNKINKFRKSLQPLLPIQKSSAIKDSYDVFPAYKLAIGKIETGFDALAKEIALHKTVVIDGYSGVLWDEFINQLNKALIATNVNPIWFDIISCLKPEMLINEMLTDNLNGNDPVFGKRYTGELADFYESEKIKLLKPDNQADICIVYGCGASLCKWEGLLIYLDIPKNEIQYRMRAQRIFNLGTNCISENTQMYKRFYFVDWPVLNNHKKQLLPQMDIIVDEQRILEISWMHGTDFREALNDLLTQVVRARPWFEAGVWGGSWMKETIVDILQDEVNYAWSFELISPENGIVFSQNNTLFEVSFDFLLYYDNVKLLGNAAKRFGTEFPIRFDYLDTINGGNLSVQCHPRTNYIKEQFGENFTQDETYYILDCKPDANVYLGFQDNIDSIAFKKALTDSQEKGTEVKITDFVQSFPAKKHDLFLIPNGTIHASGKNNMVLEISSTPYIFTFKMYDWQRLDLNGKPRPINIEHAFNNLYFDRKGSKVNETLISHPVLIAEGSNFKRYLLPTHPEHFYTIERYVFMGELLIDTNNQCHICMLVEGETIDVLIKERKHHFNYAETFVIPAAANQYIVTNKKEKEAMLVVVYIKEECC